MDRVVPVARLVEGDWVIQVGDRKWDQARQIDRITRGHFPEADPEEWGISFTDDTAVWVSGPAGMTATLHIPAYAGLDFIPGQPVPRPTGND